MENSKNLQPLLDAHRPLRQTAYPPMVEHGARLVRIYFVPDRLFDLYNYCCRLWLFSHQCSACIKHFRYRGKYGKEEPDRWIRTYYHDIVELKETLGVGHYCRDSCFVKNTVEETLSNGNVTGAIEEWNNGDQFQLCTEEMIWLGHKGDEITELCFK